VNIKKILCPTDFSGPGEEALRVALDLAGDYAAELLVVHVVEYLPPLLGGGKDPVAQFQACCRQLEGEACARLDQLIAQAAQAQIKVTTLIKIGHPAAQICEWAEKYEADLIVIASHGLTGWRKALLGSVTARLLLLTTRPIWIIHATPPKDAAAGRRS
jgi:nucleotide-binding universal stress UspA family protein